MLATSLRPSPFVVTADEPVIENEIETAPAPEVDIEVIPEVDIEEPVAEVVIETVEVVEAVEAVDETAKPKKKRKRRTKAEIKAEAVEAESVEISE